MNIFKVKSTNVTRQVELSKEYRCCNALLRINKLFIRPHLDYRDIYDKPNNESFKNKIEKVQYKVCIAITDAVQGTSQEHLYQELG